MIKKLNIIMICLLVAILLVSCSGGSYKITIGDINASDNKISGEYSGFSGYYYKQEKFNQGEIIKFNFSANTINGEISACIVDSNGKIVKEIKNEESIKIDKNDTYKIQVQGTNHEGNFILSWE